MALQKAGKRIIAKVKQAPYLFGILAILGIAAGCIVVPAQNVIRHPVDFGWHDPESVVQVQGAQINESSGIAVSGKDSSTFFTHNDSGDTARFFKFNSGGTLLGTFTLAGATALDWEDMASAKVGGIDYLYFGDIGDNNLVRSSIKVYRVSEPSGSGGPIADFDTYTLTYPDGPHNAEVLMVHPRSGDITIVTKTSSEPSKVFRVAAPPASGSYSLTLVGVISFPSNLSLGKLATAGDISADGFRVVLRTYLAAYEYAAPKKFDDWMKSQPRSIATPAEAQGEAICFSRDGMTLYTTSEGSPMPLNKIRRRRS